MLPTLSVRRVDSLLDAMRQSRVLVIGDLMLDQFIWGRVSRISPEAPVPVVDFERESFMPGGAANVARNITALGARATLGGAVGKDAAATQLQNLLVADHVDPAGVVRIQDRPTSTKIRVIASQQQIVRLDRETRDKISPRDAAKLLSLVRSQISAVDAIVLGDYGKGVVTQPLVDALRQIVRESGKWLSMDPKPVHKLDIRGLSLLTPNRKEAFELAGIPDASRSVNPLQDAPLLAVVAKLLTDLEPALLLITLGELGMLLCRRNQAPIHIGTAAREVFDVSGAGDTVIAAYTVAICAGASPVEAALVANQAAGVVVGKRGTATVTPDELRQAFRLTR